MVLRKDYGLRFLEEEQKINRSDMSKLKASKEKPSEFVLLKFKEDDTEDHF